MPAKNRSRIHDRVLGMRFMPGEPYTLEQMARALQDLWPGVGPNQVRAVVAGLASKEAWIRKQMSASQAERTARLESG